MNTPDLFEHATARARPSDPETSHKAARSVTGLTEKRQAVLRCLKQIGPMTLEELVDIYVPLAESGQLVKQAPSGIRSRCAELVDMGLVRDSGLRRPSRSNRDCVVWEVCP